jgi:hypothetical protein
MPPPELPLVLPLPEELTNPELEPDPLPVLDASRRNPDPEPPLES